MGSFRTGEGYQPADPALVAVLEAAAARSPYDVVMFSGDRDGTGGSQHDHARAVDIVLIDPTTGQEIPNLGAGGDAFGIYEQFAHTARAAQQEVAPQLGDTFRWGGYFGPSRLNPTGADLMHFDLGPTANMAMGTWEGGLNEQGRTFVAGLGDGRIYSENGRVAAPAGATYANLWGGPIAPATGGGAGATGPLGYAGSPAPLTGAAAAVTAMGAGGGDGGLPTIRNGAGSRSQPDENVRALQEFLNANGQNLRVDGVFGDMTERAVRAYQEANGLDVDGVVGPQTWGHIAGTAATAGGGEVSAIPGPVRGFVQRVFGDAGVTNLSARIDLFRQGIRKGMSPTDAFTQARGLPIPATPVPGSASANLPPKVVPIPPANPARPAAPVVPLPPDNPARQPVQPAITGDGLITRPVPKPVVGDGLVNRPYTQPTGPGLAPQPVTGDGMVVRPYTQPTGQMPAPAKPVTGDGLVNRAGPLPPMQRPLADPSLMPRGAAESSVPTTPGRNIGEGEYLPLEWQQMKQLETSRSQFPTYQRAPGAVPALIPNAPPRADAYSIKPLRREEGPLQPSTRSAWGDEPGYSFMRRSFGPLDGPPGAAPPAQFGQPPPAPIIPQARVPQIAPPNPTPYPAKPLIYDQFAGVEAPYEPPQPEERPAFVPAASAPKAGGAIDLRRPVPPAPIDMRVAPAKTPAIPQPSPLPLVPSSKSAPAAKAPAAPRPAPVIVVKAPPPPQPVIPAVVRKKAA